MTSTDQKDEETTAESADDVSSALLPDEERILDVSSSMIDHANILQAESEAIQNRLDRYLTLMFPKELQRLAEIETEHKKILSQGRLLHLQVLGSVDDRLGGNEMTKDLMYGLDWKEV